MVSKAFLKMDDTILKLDSAANIGKFDRPLQLTARQDMAGFLYKRIGRAILFSLTCVSVLAVFLIFVFIITEASSFLSLKHLAGMISSTQWYPEDAHPRFGAQIGRAHV